MTANPTAARSAAAGTDSRLIVHADDFGESVEITRGICTAIEGGAVTSTTIMANMPGTADALHRVAGLSNQASFGVHLNLCEGRPLTTGRTLVGPHGDFHGKRALFLRAISGMLSDTDVEAELRAQVAVVHDAGVRISHVDGHKHLHQLPVVCAAVARVLPHFGIERVRLTRLGSIARIRTPASLMRELLAVPAATAFRGARLRSPGRVVDVQALMDLDAGADATAFLCEPGGVVEMFCHPGTALADIEKPGSCERNAELQFLLSTRFRSLIDALGLRLVTYWDV
jgi:chitin disaccharide deacetylase